MAVRRVIGDLDPGRLCERGELTLVPRLDVAQIRFELAGRDHNEFGGRTLSGSKADSSSPKQATIRVLERQVLIADDIIPMPSNMPSWFKHLKTRNGKLIQVYMVDGSPDENSCGDVETAV